MQFEARFARVLERYFQLCICISRMAVSVVISDIVSCTQIDEFLMTKVSNSYEQHSLQMQDLKVG
jgi:hypothetical protein